MKKLTTETSVCYTGQISKHKFWEVESRDEDTMDFEFHFRANTKGDHAGVRLGWSFMYWSFDVTIYDHRHWDYDRDVWMEHP